MTAYWPTVAVMPYLEVSQRFEVMHAPVRGGISRPTMAACHRAASMIPADTTLGLMYTEGVGSRRVYLQYPNCEQWAALERGGFVETQDDFGYVMDALH